jgi:hypothetical protein
MALDHDQVTRINQWLAANVHQQWPACGLANWCQIQDGIYGLPSISLDTLNLGEGLEFIATTCKRCGYAAFFLTTRIGVGSRTPTVESS